MLCSFCSKVPAVARTEGGEVGVCQTCAMSTLPKLLQDALGGFVGGEVKKAVELSLVLANQARHGRIRRIGNKAGGVTIRPRTDLFLSLTAERKATEDITAEMVAHASRKPAVAAQLSTTTTDTPLARDNRPGSTYKNPRGTVVAGMVGAGFAV